ncbi:MAG: hypothetical protein SOZ02_04305 [Hallerella porci]|nr:MULTISPECIES: hypothetical protein [Hallerella]MDY3921369.1 hypothetical protein [Hallerella porci]
MKLFHFGIKSAAVALGAASLFGLTLAAMIRVPIPMHWISTLSKL